MPVSVVIPCYRQAHLLGEAINSLINQTYSDLDIIVVDDGSDDDVNGSTTSFNNNRIRYYRKENGGLSSARNYGMSLSKSEYVLFLDADDKLEPDAISQLKSILDKNADCDMAVMRFAFFDDTSSAYEPSGLLELSPTDFLKTVINRNIAPIHCILFRRSSIGDRLFDESLRSCEDWDFNSRLVCNGARVHTSDYVGALYRRHSSSMSSDTTRMLYYRIIVLINTISNLDNAKQLRSEWKNVFPTCERLYRRCNFHKHSSIRHVRKLLHRKLASYGLVYRIHSWYCFLLARLKSMYDSAMRPELANEYKTGYL